MSRTSGIARGVVERVLLAGLSFVGVVTLVQLLLRAAPGDAADLVARSPEQRQQLVAAWGLDAPLHEAVRSATGEPLYRVDEMWRDRFSLSSPIAWARLAGWDLMWLISALIGIVAMFVVRRRQRLRRDEIRAREVEDDALMQAIWEGRFGVR